MSIRLSCGECGQALKVADEMAGRRVKCRCGAKVDVPAGDDEAELAALPPRHTSAARKPRGKKRGGAGFSFSPRLFKTLLWVALAVVVCVIGVYAIQWGAGVATMASSMKKINELKKNTIAIIDASTDKIRKNREAVEGLLRNPRAVPTTDAVRPLLEQIAADSNAVLNSLASVQVPEGLVEGNEFVGAWRDTIRNQSELLTTGIPPLVELRNDESRSASERVLEVEIKLAEFRVKDLEELLAMLARHLEFYKKNKTGMSPGEVALRQNMETKLSGARDDLRRLTGQRKPQAGAPAVASGGPATTPPAGFLDLTKPETWGTPAVPTDEIKSQDRLKRGMKVWAFVLKWERAEILGPGSNAGTIVYRYTGGPFLDRWTQSQPPDPHFRIEGSELDRADLKDVPPLSADTPITPKQIHEANMSLKKAGK